MGINPIAAARKEAQRQTYIDEERKLVELGKRRTDAAKKAASENKEKDLIGAKDAKRENVFDKIGRDYEESSRQQKEDEKDDEWLREFETSLKEETGTKSYQSPITKAANTRNETFMKAYESGEKWLMSEGNDDVVKAFINRMRSSVGKGVEDFAYMLNDIAPWYEPAKNVVEKNTAGNISAKADKQFENAKEKTGDFGDNLIDISDGAAETLGLSMFGPKALTYAFGTKEGFREYRKQRENGVSEEVAFRRALAKAGYSVAVEKADDYLGDWIIKHTPPNNRLGLASGILPYVSKIEDDIYYPKTSREASAFNRSFANQTSSLKNGKTKRIIIDTADNTYFIEANGYMSGEIKLVIPIDENAEWLRNHRRSFLDGSYEPSEENIEFAENRWV